MDEVRMELRGWWEICRARVEVSDGGTGRFLDCSHLGTMDECKWGTLVC